MKALIIIALIAMGWFLPSYVEAVTPAASCSYADVTAAIIAVPADGTVTIPGGTCSWATRYLITGKSFTLQGAGAGTEAQCAGQSSSSGTYTCLTMAPSLTGGILAWTMVTTGKPRITGITFDGGATGAQGAETDGIVRLQGDTDQFRFDHNRLITRRIPGLSIFGSVRGVIDHNDLGMKANQGFNHFIAYVNHPGWNGGATCVGGPAFGCGDKSWAAPTAFGSSGFLFFENNTLDRGTDGSVFAIDGWTGQRIVTRFNTLLNVTTENHGSDSTGRSRGGRAMEHYMNTIIVSNTDLPSIHGSRGGTGLIWGNEATTSGGHTLDRVGELSHYRVLALQSSGQCAYWLCADDGDGVTGNNRYDAGYPNANGYPAMDQIGRGQGDLITGAGSGTNWKTLPSPAPIGWPNQALEPFYCWDNNINGANSACTRNAPNTNFLQENRDFYTEGSLNGVGSGVRASRPSAPCTSGTAYWASDGGTNWNLTNGNGVDGGLDLCVATAWVNDWYVPYTYPHPLVQGDVPPSPTNPTGVRVIGTTSTSGTLVWTPSTNSDFKSYHIYHGLASGSYTFPTVTITAVSAAAAHKPLAEYTFKSAVGGTHYFVVTEVNTLDLESAPSSEVSVALSVPTRSLSPTRTISPQRCNRASGCGSPSSGSNILSESGDKIIIEIGGGFAIKEN